MDSATKVLVATAVASVVTAVVLAATKEMGVSEWGVASAMGVVSAMVVALEIEADLGIGVDLEIEVDSEAAVGDGDLAVECTRYLD